MHLEMPIEKEPDTEEMPNEGDAAIEKMSRKSVKSVIT